MSAHGHGKAQHTLHGHVTNLQQQLVCMKCLGNPNVCPLCSGGFMPHAQGRNGAEVKCPECNFPHTIQMRMCIFLCLSM